MDLTVLVTQRCNLRCAHCLREHPDKPKDLDMEVYERVLDDCRQAGFHAVHFTGGEPCLHPRFSDMVDLTVAKGFRFSINTNGWIVNRYLPVVEKNRASFDYFSISVDGARPETHDEQRKRVGSFDHALEAIRSYSAAGFFVKVGTCISKINVDELEETIRVTRAAGARCNLLITLVPSKGNQDIRLSRTEHRKLLDRSQALRHRENLDQIYHCSALYTGCGWDFCRITDGSALSVNTSGNFIFCCDTPYDGAVIGNYEELGFWEILRRANRCSARLRKARLDALVAGERFDGTDGCLFCLRHLADQITVY